jgi:hypothetical protein
MGRSKGIPGGPAPSKMAPRLADFPLPTILIAIIISAFGFNGAAVGSFPLS